MLFLIRHGETEWNREGRLQGWRDSPLAAGAEAQVERIAARLAARPVAHLYTSDLGRAVRTADIVGRKLGLTPQSNASLRECSYGRCEGLTNAEIDAQFSGIRRARNADRWNNAYPDGESFREFFARVQKFLVDENVRDRSTASDILIVGHKGVSRAVTAWFNNAPYDDVAGLEHQSNEIWTLSPNRPLHVQKI